jgi:hypothetical protein
MCSAATPEARQDAMGCTGYHHQVSRFNNAVLHGLRRSVYRVWDEDRLEKLGLLKRL